MVVLREADGPTASLTGTTLLDAADGSASRDDMVVCATSPEAIGVVGRASRLNTALDAGVHSPVR